jgi:hypothetical protein
MKKTLLTIFVAGTLVLTGCTAAEETDTSNNGAVSGGETTSGESTVDTSTANIDTLFALTPAEVLALAPSEIEEGVAAELSAIVTASIEKSKQGMSEQSYNNLGGESYTVSYMTPDRTEAGVSAIFDESGNVIPGVTSFLQSEYSFSLYSLSVAFEAEAVAGIKKANDNSYYLKVVYPASEELGLDEITISFFVSVDEGLVNGILYTDNSSEEPILFKTVVAYGKDSKLDELFDSAVPFDQLPGAGEIISEENNPDTSESFDDVVVEDGITNSNG